LFTSSWTDLASSIAEHTHLLMMENLQYQYECTGKTNGSITYFSRDDLSSHQRVLFDLLELDVPVGLHSQAC
jgi:hypothetical protein